jgi:hypothetical protein
MADNPREVKDHLLDDILYIRGKVLDQVKEGVKDSQLVVGAAESAAWDGYYAGLALAWNGLNVVGTLVSPVPGGSVVGAIMAGVGGLGAIYSGYQQNFNKPDFSKPQNLVDEVKDKIIRKLKAVDAQEHHQVWRLNTLKQALYDKYRNDSIYGKALYDTDGKFLRRDLIWKECFRGINPDNFENQIHDRTKNAIEALFKLVVDFYKQSSDFAAGKVADLPSPGRVWKKDPGEGGYFEELPPSAADVAKTRSAYLRPDHFIERLRNAGTYKRWLHDHKVVFLPTYL